VIDLDADCLKICVSLQRMVDSFSTRSRLFAAAERHVQTSNEPTVFPDGSNLNKKSI